MIDSAVRWSVWPGGRIVTSYHQQSGQCPRLCHTAQPLQVRDNWRLWSYHIAVEPSYYEIASSWDLGLVIAPWISKTFTRWLWTEYCDPTPRSPWRQWSHIVRLTLCPDRKISLALLPSPWLEVIQVEDDLGGSHATASASDDSRQHEGVKRQADRVSVQDLLRACPPQVATQTEVS